MYIEAASDFLGEHPLVGSILSLLFILIAAVTEQAQIPLIVMQCAQMLAWIMAILVAAMTLVGQYHKFRKRDNDI